MICPTCDRPLTFDQREEYMPGLGRAVEIVDGWGYCEPCSQDAALDAMRERTPWLFRQTGSVDEHDVMAQMVAAGHDGWPVSR